MHRGCRGETGITQERGGGVDQGGAVRGWWRRIHTRSSCFGHTDFKMLCLMEVAMPGSSVG